MSEQFSELFLLAKAEINALKARNAALKETNRQLQTVIRELRQVRSSSSNVLSVLPWRYDCAHALTASLLQICLGGLREGVCQI